MFQMNLTAEIYLKGSKVLFSMVPDDTNFIYEPEPNKKACAYMAVNQTFEGQENQHGYLVCPTQYSYA